MVHGGGARSCRTISSSLGFLRTLGEEPPCLPAAASAEVPCTPAIAAMLPRLSQADFRERERRTLSCSTGETSWRHSDGDAVCDCRAGSDGKVAENSERGRAWPFRVLQQGVWHNQLLLITGECFGRSEAGTTTQMAVPLMSRCRRILVARLPRMVLPRRPRPPTTKHPLTPGTSRHGGSS